jgi:hypothetical protein
MGGEGEVLTKHVFLASADFTSATARRYSHPPIAEINDFYSYIQIRKTAGLSHIRIVQHLYAQSKLSENLTAMQCILYR